MAGYLFVLVLAASCLLPCCLTGSAHSTSAILDGETHKKQGTEDNTSYRHIVFIGDSLMRYQYLSYVYFLHFGHINGMQAVLKNATIWWPAYYQSTTDLFQGRMICDCVRNKHEFRENRYYEHTSSRIFVSFFLNFGDNPIDGRRSVFAVPRGSNSDRRNFTFTNPANGWSTFLLEFLAGPLRELRPAPTVLILNAGHHTHSNLTHHISSIILNARRVVSSRERLHETKEYSQNNSRTSSPSSASLSEPSCMLWQETSPRRDALTEDIYASTAESNSIILAKGLCLKNHSRDSGGGDLSATSYLAALSSLHQYLAKTITDLKLLLPPPSVSVSAIDKSNHSAVTEEYNSTFTNIVTTTLEQIAEQTAKSSIPRGSYHIVRSWFQGDMHWDVDKKSAIASTATPNNYTSVTPSSFIRALVKLDHLLLSGHAVAVSESRVRDNAEEAAPSPPCLYVPFSMTWIRSREAYMDEVHFQDTSVYHQRNVAAFSACNLTLTLTLLPRLP